MICIFFPQAVPTSKGQALADEYGIKFFETVRSQKFCLILLLYFHFLVADSPVHFLLDVIKCCRVQRQISMWSRFSFQLLEILSKGLLKLITKLRYEFYSKSKLIFLPSLNLYFIFLTVMWLDLCHFTFSG